MQSSAVIAVPRESHLIISSTTWHGIICLDKRPVTDTVPESLCYTTSRLFKFYTQAGTPSMEFAIKAPLSLSSGHVVRSRGQWEEIQFFEPDGSLGQKFKPQGEDSEHSSQSTRRAILATCNPVGSNTLHFFGDGTFDLGLSKKEFFDSFKGVAEHLTTALGWNEGSNEFPGDEMESGKVA